MPSVDKVRLLFLAADKFPPFRVDVAVLFGRELVGRGYEIDWLLQSDAECQQPYKTEWQSGKVWVGATNNGISRWNRLKKHLLDIRNDLKVFRLTRQKNYHCVLVKDKFISALLAIIAAGTRKARFVYWLSYPFPEASLYRAQNGSARYPLFYFVRGWCFRFLLYHIIMPKADHIFVQSEQMKNDVMANGVEVEKLTAVPMGVEIAKVPYRKGLQVLDRKGKDKKIVYLGTVARVRKIDFLVRVFSLVRDLVPEAKLYLVGGGDDPVDEQLIINEAARLGVADAVVITGFLPMKTAWEYVQTADVCVSPFCPTFILNSTSPTKLIEYMAMGKAVVGNDHPEQQQVLRDSSGGLCVPYREEAFAAAVVELLRNPQKAAVMGRNGREYVERYRTYRAIADIVEQQFRRILCGGQADE